MCKKEVEDVVEESFEFWASSAAAVAAFSSCEATTGECVINIVGGSSSNNNGQCIIKYEPLAAVGETAATITGVYYVTCERL